jgi:hypothetical protein
MTTKLELTGSNTSPKFELGESIQDFTAVVTSRLTYVPGFEMDVDVAIDAPTPGAFA